MSFKAAYKYDEYECSGDGPRPPVPGGESKAVPMTEGYSHVLSTNYRDSAAFSMAAGCAVPTGASSSSASALPSYMKWAQSLSYLLGDREGVALFKLFVEHEGGIHQDRLKFFLACDGLADVREPEKIKQMIDAIYKFLKRTQIPVSEEVRGAIKLLRRNELEPRTDIFDKMYEEVRHTMAQTTFISFLKSDIYLGHVQSMTSTNRGPMSGLSTASSMTGSHSSSNSSAGSSSGAVGGAVAAGAGSSGVGGQMGPPAPVTGGPPVSTTTPTLVTSSAVAANSMVIGTALGADHLTRSLTLPTLHEDSELVCDNIVSISATTQFGGAAATGSVGGVRGKAPAEPPMRLTKDSLLATEARRLEVRPPGAHGYSFFNNNYESYNTVSLQDSERQSYSSGQTDSDTASMASSKMDGRPYVPRRSSSMEHRAMRQSAMQNKEPDVTAIIPRTSRMHNNAHIALKPEDLVSRLFPKLEEIKKKQDIEDLFTKKMHESGNDPSSTVAEKAAMFHSELRDAIRDKLPMEDTMDDQSILDMHVKRVWQDHTPNRSPGTVSPGPLAALRSRRTNEFVLQLNYGAGAMGGSGMDMKYGGDGNSSNNSIISGSGGQSQSQQMRHSRSMPGDQHQQQQQRSKTLTNKWPSMQTDSGISLFSGDTLIKKDQSSRKHMSMMGSDGSSMTTALQLEEARRRLEDETKRSRSRHAAPLPLPTQQMMMHMSADECTTVVFSFCDEQFPYRTKIPGKQPTLKQFKDYLPKKGSFRFFFKTLCEDNTVIQEEMMNDTDILPLYEGKVMALVRPSE